MVVVTPPAIESDSTSSEPTKTVKKVEAPTTIKQTVVKNIKSKNGKKKKVIVKKVVKTASPKKKVVVVKPNITKVANKTEEVEAVLNDTDVVDKKNKIEYLENLQNDLEEVTAKISKQKNELKMKKA